MCIFLFKQTGCCAPQQVNALTAHVMNNFVALSQLKYASNVVEKCLVKASPEMIRSAMNEILVKPAEWVLHSKFYLMISTKKGFQDDLLNRKKSISLFFSVGWNDCVPMRMQITSCKNWSIRQPTSKLWSCTISCIRTNQIWNDKFVAERSLIYWANTFWTKHFRPLFEFDHLQLINFYFYFHCFEYVRCFEHFPSVFSV